MDKKNYIGKTEYSYIFQRIGRDRLISGFDEYSLVETVDGTKGLECIGWTHNINLDNGKTYKSGDKVAKVKKMPKDIEGLYEINTFSCDECGAQHDADAYSNEMTYILVGECMVLCRDCVKADDIMTPIVEPADFFKSQNVQGIDLPGYEEIDTLFCDSSGFGSDSELALTKQGAEKRIASLIAEYGEIYSGLTGIGQFQVYVTIYRKVKNRKRASKSA